jgi:hypothetical protein
MEINQPKKVKMEMRGSELRSGVYCQGMLKAERPKTRTWYIGSENFIHVSMYVNYRYGT